MFMDNIEEDDLKGTTISKTDMSWINHALKVSKKSSHPKHKMAAIVVRGGSLLSSASNLHLRYKHAEIRALRPHLNLKGGTLYVVRKNGGNSRPCEVCWNSIVNSGINTVVFINEKKDIVIEKVT